MLKKVKNTYFFKETFTDLMNIKGEDQMLIITDISYSYKDETILQNVSQVFDAGKIHTIIGQSGVGKSTFLSLISGLEFLQSGSIEFQGQSMTNLVSYRRQISYIFQSLNLIPYLSPLENITIATNIHKVKNPQSPSSYLNKVGICGDIQHKKCHQLSGGQQQRVAIARALALDSDLIIADEPTGSLDLANSENVMTIFKDLRDAGKCIIIVSHDLTFKEISDYVYTIKNGRLTLL